MGSSPVLDQDFFVQVFSALWAFFSQSFSTSPKGPPSVFSILQKNGCSKTLQDAPFYIFRHYVIYRRPKNIKKYFKKVSGSFSIYSSCGYCRREYLKLRCPVDIFEPQILGLLKPFPIFFLSCVQSYLLVVTLKNVSSDIRTLNWDSVSLTRLWVHPVPSL